MDRHRIVDQGLNVSLMQMSLQVVAPLAGQDEQMINVCGRLFGGRKQPDRWIFDSCLKGMGDLFASLREFGQPFQAFRQ